MTPGQRADALEAGGISGVRFSLSRAARLIAPRPSVHADGYLEYITDNDLLKMGPASSFQGIEPDVTKEVRACSNRPDTWSDICVTHACSPSAFPSSPWGPPPRSRGRHSLPRPPRPSISSPS